MNPNNEWNIVVEPIFVFLHENEGEKQQWQLRFNHRYKPIFI